MIVPDLNLLVYAHSTGAPLHTPARRWWEELVNGTERVGVPWVVAAGFVRLLTHPGVLSDPAGPEQAVDLMAEWFRAPSVSPLNPGARHLAIFRSMLGAAGAGGDLVTDAHIAALAVEHQAEVHSNDSDFARFPGLRWRNPI
ncbi:MAG: type II toxin-antitoxin system VapC family toxin [bacterium]|nr:type II toxin-antitoxin system VapC family toxin [bacterium]